MSRIEFRAFPFIKPISCICFGSESISWRTLSYWSTKFSFSDFQLEDKPCRGRTMLLDEQAFRGAVEPKPISTIRKLMGGMGAHSNHIAKSLDFSRHVRKMLCVFCGAWERRDARAESQTAAVYSGVSFPIYLPFPYISSSPLASQVPPVCTSKFVVKLIPLQILFSVFVFVYWAYNIRDELRSRYNALYFRNLMPWSNKTKA